MKYFTIIVCLILFFSCAPKKEEKKKKEPLMYEPTEMALLMRTMYEYNRVLKKRIVENDSLGDFPKEFLEIHGAKMTDETERDSAFEALSKKYMKLQQSVFTAKDSVKTKFNQTVASCVECHQTRCTGPIPKIKRLLIN